MYAKLEQHSEYYQNFRNSTPNFSDSFGIEMLVCHIGFEALPKF